MYYVKTEKYYIVLIINCLTKGRILLINNNFRKSMVDFLCPVEMGSNNIFIMISNVSKRALSLSVITLSKLFGYFEYPLQVLILLL